MKSFLHRQAVLLIACGLAQTACGLARAADPPTPDPSRFAQEIAAFQSYDRKNSWPADAILFVGSSSIRLWNTAEAFSNHTVINRGFGGSHISDVNHFAERIVLKYEPRTIVFYCGDNDVFFGKPPEQVFGDFKAFVALVRERLPETQIIYLPIKPSTARWKLWPQMQDVNARVRALTASDPHLAYVDTATPMLGPDGSPRANLYQKDELHLSPAGYKLWNDLLRPALGQPQQR